MASPGGTHLPQRILPLRPTREGRETTNRLTRDEEPPRAGVLSDTREDPLWLRPVHSTPTGST